MTAQSGIDEGRKRKEALSREMLAVLDGIELLVKQLVVAARQAAVYQADHPVVREHAEKAYETVQEIFRRKEAFSITIREDLLVYENIPLYRLSLNSRRFINLLEEKKIGGMTLSRGLNLDELVTFVGLLVALPAELESHEDISSELESRGVTHIKLLAPVKEEKGAAVARIPKEVYKEAVRTMRRTTRAITMGSPPDIKAIDLLVSEIRDGVQKKPQVMLAMASIKSYDDSSFTHSVNVCVLSMALASLFIRDEKELCKLGQAALLHDIGKALVPPEILNKPGPLDEGEKETMRRHPVNGARILAETEGAGPLSVIVAFEHHRGYDAAGYPPVTGGTRPHPMSLLVQVADVYETMTSVRPYGKPVTPERAMAEMTSAAGKALEPRLLKEFVGMMGVFPPGTLVELDTGEIAMVVRVNKNNFLRPVVKIVRGAGGEILEEPFLEDLNERDRLTGRCARSIVRSLESERTDIDKLLYII